MSCRRPGRLIDLQMQRSGYAVITPVRNEVNHLPATLTSLCAQTLRPWKWVIVDDGSNDGTHEIIDQASKDHDWIVGCRRADRGFRKAGGGVIDAFYDGYQKIADGSWEFLVKLDGDLSFEPDYFARCLQHFSADPRLGIAGGSVCQASGNTLVVESAVDPEFHVRGATKIYRRACWDQIGGLIRAPGWDTVDEFKANMLGWRTRTFPELTVIHHRQAGDAYGQWHNWTKNGLANYVAGYHPLFMFVKCVKRAFHKPLFVVAAGLWVGFCLGYLTRVPQVPDRDVVRYVRRQQIRRMLLRPSVYSSQ